LGNIDDAGDMDSTMFKLRIATETERGRESTNPHHQIARDDTARMHHRVLGWIDIERRIDIE
jgi:hypothetical protein